MPPCTWLCGLVLFLPSKKLFPRANCISEVDYYGISIFFKNDCVHYLNAGLSEEGQELVTLPPALAAGRLSFQTSSVDSTGTNSSLGQADCSGSPSQENAGQMVPSHVFQNETSLFQGYSFLCNLYVLFVLMQVLIYALRSQRM